MSGRFSGWGRRFRVRLSARWAARWIAFTVLPALCGTEDDQMTSGGHVDHVALMALRLR
jgi:hypothetical protein